MKLVEIYKKILLESDDNFKKWFGNSKVTEGGKPLVCYHGSSQSNIKAFEMEYPRNAAGNFKGIYFTDDKNDASVYGSIMYKCFLKIEHPLIGNPYEEYCKDKNIDYEKNRFNIKKADVEEWIQQNNFDGIIRPKGTKYNLDGAEFILLHGSNQIKSIDNDGTWDINDDNIYS